MRFVSVRDLRGRSGEIWRSLPEEKELVLTSNGRPIAILSAVSEDSVEESLAAIRRARAAVALAALQRRSATTRAGRLKLREIDAEIAAARRKRRR
jgi:antitoxin (DNA-binding transcriptional repressor) of toxin-antitoxin stability system